MVVTYSAPREDISAKVLLINGQKQQVVVDIENHGMKILGISYLKAATNPEKEKALEKFMIAWRGQNLDVSFDDKGSSTTLEQAFNVMWEVIKEIRNELL